MTVLWYGTMLSDGDSKAFDAVRDLKLYDVPIKKEECINHVAKRLTTALNTLVSKHKGTNRPISGRGMLTQNLIKTLHSYYRKAIKDNPGNVDAMKKAILAAPYHITSNDDNHNHSYCPTNGWCWFNNPEKEQRHKPDLPHDMLAIILPTYERLGNTALLERCAKVSTQNANECLNGEIWKRCPKTDWFGRKAVTISAIMGVLAFNGGHFELERSSKHYGLQRTEAIRKHSTGKDSKRLAAASKRDATTRKAKAWKRVTERQRQIQKGVTYAAGKFGA